MNTVTKICARTLILAALHGTASAQQPSPQSPGTPAPAPHSTAQIDAGEPRADGAAPGAGASAAGEPAAPTPPATPQRPATKAAAGARGQGAPAIAPGQKSSAADRLNLTTTTVTGDHEQPKVMYVVPWKSANIGDLSGKPMNSLLDEALAPVDREEFRREVAYYDAVKAQAPHDGAPGKQGEK
jgi:hypothetical protein